MTLSEARSAVHQKLTEEMFSEPFVILDDATTVRDSCFVFYWTLQSAFEGGSPIAGNAPCLVDRQTGHVYFTGTCFSPEIFIQAFERFGTLAAAFGRIPCTLTITGWRKGAQTVSAIQRLRDSGRFTLAPAKAIIDSVLAGAAESLHDLMPDAALSLSEDLCALGFETRLSTNQSEQIGPPNSHACGTFGTSAAEQPLVPKASGSR